MAVFICIFSVDWFITAYEKWIESIFHATALRVYGVYILEKSGNAQKSYNYKRKKGKKISVRKWLRFVEQ